MRWHDLFLKLRKTPAACWQWPQLEACFTIWAKGYHFLTELLSGPVWGREFLLLMLYQWQRLLQHAQRSQRPWCSQGWAAMPLKVSLTYCYNPHSCFVWKSRSVNSPSRLCFTLDSVSRLKSRSAVSRWTRKCHMMTQQHCLWQWNLYNIEGTEGPLTYQLRDQRVIPGTPLQLVLVLTEILNFKLFLVMV